MAVAFEHCFFVEPGRLGDMLLQPIALGLVYLGLKFSQV